MGQVIPIDRSKDPLVVSILKLKSCRFETTLKNKEISGTVTEVFWDPENNRVILTLDTITIDDGQPLCVDLYPFGVPDKKMRTPFGTHVLVKARFGRML